MSFLGTKSDARTICGEIQEHKTDGSDGGTSSPIYAGSSNSGASMKDPIGEMKMRRTTAKLRTGSLERKYASTGSGG